jgi:hypothetical protein
MLQRKCGRTGLLIYPGVEFLSLPRAALQSRWHSFSLRCSVQFYVFNSVWQQFSEIAIALRLPVSLVFPRPYCIPTHRETRCYVASTGAGEDISFHILGGHCDWSSKHLRDLSYGEYTMLIRVLTPNTDSNNWKSSTTFSYWRSKAVASSRF